jgi:hypothetical protein
LLLNRPVLFFAVVALALGLLGGLGLIGSRNGPQLVPAGAIGFAYGVSLGVFFAAAFFLLRRAAESRWSAKVTGFVGTALIWGCSCSLRGRRFEAAFSTPLRSGVGGHS